MILYQIVIYHDFKIIKYGGNGRMLLKNFIEYISLISFEINSIIEEACTEVILGAESGKYGNLKNLGMKKKKGQICILLSWT